jgi:peptidoglycan/LPS O-acetylase OafA/YrhL
MDALDGVRALAIASVLGAHASAHLRGGFLGVDLFFVLSGFLITGLLLAEHDKTGEIRLKRFFARRCLRLLPLYVVVAAVVLAVTMAFYADRLYYGFTVSTASLATYTTNVLEVLQPDCLYLLNHTWTLAIEWQFYLVWPPLLAVLLSRGHAARTIGCWLVAAAIVAAVGRAYQWHTDPNVRWHFSTMSHADLLLLGAAFACLRAAEHDGQRVVSDVLAHRLSVAVAVCLVGAAILVQLPQGFLYLGGYALFGLASVSLVAFAMQGRGVLHRLLCARGVVRLGQISYGVYLVHFPVFALLSQRTALPHAVWVPTACVLTLVIAELSFRKLEQPFLRLKDVRFAALDASGIAARARRDVPLLQVRSGSL